MDKYLENSPTYQEITGHLYTLSNPKIAEHSRHFFKTGEGEYGYGDSFLGIRVPVIRQAVKKYRETPLIVTKELLKSDFHEIRLFALLLLSHQFQRSDNNVQEKIYKLYLNHTAYVNNWDLVDSSAHHIVGAYLEKRDRSILNDLAKSTMLWERRIAIIATFYFIRKNQLNDTFRISKLLLGDQEDLIHKATGWMLREAGKRDRDREIAFLKKHYQKMPRTMLRYAIEKFDKEDRKKYLNGNF